MRKEIEDRIREVYPTGDIDERNEDALYGEDYLEKFRSVVREAIKDTGLRGEFLVFWDSEAGFKITITEYPHPAPSQWLFGMKNENKLAWIHENGRPFPVMWLKVSRVFPAYELYYNLWKPRGDTGYLDTEYTKSPVSDMWAVFHERLHQGMEGAGIVIIPQDEGRELVEFVTEDVYEVEDCNDLPEDAPPRKVIQNVYSCLFPIT